MPEAGLSGAPSFLIRGEIIFATPVACPVPGSRALPLTYTNHMEVPRLEIRYYPSYGVVTMSWPVNEDNQYDPDAADMCKPVIVFQGAISHITQY